MDNEKILRGTFNENGKTNSLFEKNLWREKRWIYQK